MLRQRLGQLNQLRLTISDSGWIVGTRDKQELRPLSHRSTHRSQVMPKIFHRHLDWCRAKQLSNQLVNNKRLRAHDHLISRLQENMAKQLDNLVRPIADDNCILRDPPLSSDCLPQLRASAIRIQLGLLKTAFRRGNRLWRRTEWILIRSQLRNFIRLKTIFPRHILDRLTGLIDWLLQHTSVRKFSVFH